MIWMIPEASPFRLSPLNDPPLFPRPSLPFLELIEKPDGSPSLPLTPPAVVWAELE
jgi:hypothetical protein